MNNEPFISVIVPVYNSEETIGACIESLLAQEYPRDRCEIVIVDNKSTDNTPQIVKGSRVRYLLEDRIKGSYAARNAGIRNAKGSILAFTDADCIADKDWLKNGATGFIDESIGCVAGAIKSLEPQTYIEEYLGARDILTQEDRPSDMPMPYAKTANAFYRKEVFEKIGFIEERWVSGGDADLSWRMQLEGMYKLKFIPEATVLHKHRSSVNSLFRQCMTWGIGSTLLFKKHSGLMPKRTWRQTLWILWRIAQVGAISYNRKRGEKSRTLMGAGGLDQAIRGPPKKGFQINGFSGPRGTITSVFPVPGRATRATGACRCRERRCNGSRPSCR